jgi:hypothetical protein
MAWYPLRYKGAEILTPEEWNTVIDALFDLHTRVQGGLTTLTADGIRDTFKFTHNIGETPVSVVVCKASPNLPDIDYCTADETYITVKFKMPPPEGNFKLYWIALKAPASVG